MFVMKIPWLFCQCFTMFNYKNVFKCVADQIPKCSIIWKREMQQVFTTEELATVNVRCCLIDYLKKNMKRLIISSYCFLFYYCCNIFPLVRKHKAPPLLWKSLWAPGWSVLMKCQSAVSHAAFQPRYAVTYRTCLGSSQEALDCVKPPRQ